MLKSLHPMAAAFCHLLVWGCVATATAGDNGAAARRSDEPIRESLTRETSSPRVEESRPSIFYLPDKDGNLQPVLDFKYQDFAELYNLKNQLGRRDQPPHFSLQRMSAAGTATETHAELTIQFQAVVRDDDWVRIPLRLDQGLLRGDIQYKGSGKHLVQYEGEGAGYVCWIRGKPDTQHEIALTMLVPLDSASDETRLKLSVPRATASEMKLSVPIAGAVGTVSEGATLSSAAANGPKGATTEFNVIGLGNDFQLTWHKPNPTAAETPVVLESSGTVLAKLDGSSISTEATLTVRSLGAAFDRFKVRLPPDVEFIANKPNGYTVTPLDAVGEAKNGKPLGPRLVEVQLPKKTVGPVEIRLNCRRAYDPAKIAVWCELAGFEVVGAARQWGTLAVAAGGDWQVLWGPSRETRQVDSLPSGVRKDDVIAGFDYSCQPYSLLVKLVPRRTRISVNPEYVLLVDRNQARLEGKLTYTIRGAKVSTLEIEMPGWELDEVGPDNLVTLDGVTTQSNVVSIPLKRPVLGAVELQLQAHRTIKANTATNAITTSLAIPLPCPRGGAIGPISLAVVPADNVELTPKVNAITGLVRQRIVPPMKLPERQQDPIYYRGTGGDAVFAADFQVHSQRVVVEATGNIKLVDRRAIVEQKFAYSIAHEPVDQLTIAIPRKLAVAKRIQVRIDDGKPVFPVVAARDFAGDDVAATVSAKVTLPEPRIGVCELSLSYSIPLADFGKARTGSETTRAKPGKLASAEASIPVVPQTITVPLAMPEDGELLTSTLAVATEKNTRATPRKGAWTVSDREAGELDDRQGLLLTASKRTNLLDLNLRREGNGEAEAIIVDRAWIQSWLTPTARQDRAVFQFATDQKELEVALPADAATKAVVLVDGHLVEPQSLGENRLLIPLDSRLGERRFVVELRYHFAGPRPSRGAIGMEFPQLIPKAWTRRVYWQLILPANEHLVANLSGFTGEFAWEWTGWFWGRNPLLDQAQLESWSGASPRDALPERANLYLFSTLGTVGQAKIWTASRTWIVLWASGAALIAGLLLIYIPASRHPATLLTVGMALLAVGLIAPESTLLLAQAACLGLLLTLLAGMLERRVARRRQAIARTEASRSRAEIGSTHTGFRPSFVGSSSSTRMAQHIPPQSTGDVEQ